MEERKKIMKYMPSMAGFSVNDTAITSYNSGCQRSILFAAHGIRNKSIPELYKVIGDMNERRWQNELLADTNVMEAYRESPVKRPVPNTEVEFSGRADFLVTYADGTEEVHECKATVSRSSFQALKRSGTAKLNHLAQIISYMIQMKFQDGKLIYGYYEYPFGESDEIYCSDSVVLQVRIEDNGQITVGGNPTVYTVADQLAHLNLVVKTLETNELGPRPASESAWFSPCKMCPFSSVCTAIEDQTETSLEVTLQMAQVALDQAVEREPEVYRPRRKKQIA